MTTNRFSDAMRRRKLTNAALGERVGVLAQQISKVRRGVKRPSPQVAMRIAAELGNEVTKGDLRPDIWPELVTPEQPAQIAAE